MIGSARARGLLWCLPLALAASACSTGLGTGGRSSASSELDQLRQRIVELQREAAMREVEIARLKQELNELDRELQAGRDRQAELQVEARTRPLAEAETTAAPGRLDRRDAGIEESDLEAPGPAAPPPPAEPARRQLEAPVDNADSQALYDRGYTLFHQKRYAQAEGSFQRYLDLYPASGLADNAQFWIGESRYARGDFSSALAAFYATVERYPEGNKVADALLKAGKCLEALGQTDQAVSTYEEVRTRFPRSVAALSAEERLAKLRP